MSCHERVKWQSSRKREHMQWPVNSRLFGGLGGGGVYVGNCQLQNVE